jgi:hypothetical protein
VWQLSGCEDIPAPDEPMEGVWEITNGDGGGFEGLFQEGAVPFRFEGTIPGWHYCE